MRLSRLLSKKQVCFLILVVAAILVFWGSITLESYFQGAVNFLKNYAVEKPFLSILIFVGVAALSAMLFMFSSIWIVPAAILIWGQFQTTLLLFLGWFLGGLLSYWIGRYAGSNVVGYFVSAKNFQKIARYREIFRQKTGWLFIFLARLALPSEIPGYASGLAGYHWSKYLWATILAEIPYAFFTVYLIETVINREPLLLITLAVLWLTITALLFQLFRRQLQAATFPQ